MKLWVLNGKPMFKNLAIRKIIAAFLIIFISTFIILEGLIIYNGFCNEDSKTGYLIILGAGLEGSRVSLTLKNRLDKGLNYLHKYPESLVIVSGGQGSHELISEAEAMKQYLLHNGIDNKRRAFKFLLKS
jgi:uncharacterized SAM-binding protein YcdF (DUF218 family)